MPLDTRIALSGQPLQVQFRDPIAGYNQLAQLTSADTQNQLAQMQMQEHQQMAPYRMQEAQTKAASAKLTFDKAVEARDFIAQTMKAAEENSGGTAPKDPLGVIKAFLGHPNKQVQDVGTHMANAYQLIQDFEAEQRYITAKGGANKAPADVAAAAPAVPAPPMAVAAPVAPQEMFVTKDSSGRPRYVVNGVEVTPEEYQSVQSGVVANAISAAKPSRVEMPAIDNALAATPAANVNALIAPVAKTAADIKAEIDSGDLQFGRSKRWANERALLVEQFKELVKSPLAKIDPKDYTPDSFAAFMQTGNPSKLLKAKDERLAFDQAKFDWEKANPGKTIKEVTQDGVTKYFAIDNRTGEGTPVTIAGGKVLTGTDIAAQRLAFDQAKFDWEKANPGKTIKEITQNGVTKYFAIDNRTGESTPVTVAGGKILTGTDMASQRLAFDQAKFAWEKANPGFTIQQTEDGSIVGVNNRTLQAYPVTLNAGAPPSPAPFTGIGGVAPTAGAGRGSVGITDNRPALIAPAVVPAGVPLKGKSAGLTESQGNATAFGMRMQESHDLLKKLEKAGATDTGIVRGVIGGTLGLTPLIGDKLNDATGNIFNALPTVLGGLNEQQQQTINARINFITALLRKESGAAIGPSEFATAEKLYFPKPGDSKSVIEQKQRARELAIQAMKIQAGPGAKNIGVSQDESASSESDPLGIRK